MNGYIMTMGIAVILILVALFFGIQDNLAMASATGFAGFIMYITAMLADRERKKSAKSGKKAV